MPSFTSDLRYAARELRRRPGFAVTAILSLALGIGATSAVFSVIYGVLMDPFPYVGADRMMQLSLRDTEGRLRYLGMSAAHLDRLREVEVVESAVGENGWNLTMTDGDIPEDVVASYVTPNHPNHWGVPALLGRWLVLWSQDEVRRGAALAVINQTTAKMYWPVGGAVGRKIKFAALKDKPPYSPMATGGDGWVEIMGVVADARNDGLRNPLKPSMYVPYTLKMRMGTQILVRTRVPPLSMLRDVRAQIARVDREQQVTRVRDLGEWITGAPEYAQMRLVANLFAIFSALALTLSAVGL